MDTLKWFNNLDVDFSPIGLRRIKENLKYRYFCTPTNAIIFADLGVDGVHFCLLPKTNTADLNKAEIYIIDPSSIDYCVEPIAKNIHSFLDMLITIENTNVFSWISSMSKSEFKETFYNGYKYIDSSEEKKLLRILSEKITPTFDSIDKVYDEVKKLQSKFKINEINFPDEYYECLGIEKKIQN